MVTRQCYQKPFEERNPEIPIKMYKFSLVLRAAEIETADREGAEFETTAKVKACNLFIARRALLEQAWSRQMLVSHIEEIEV